MSLEDLFASVDCQHLSGCGERNNFRSWGLVGGTSVTGEMGGLEGLIPFSFSSVRCTMPPQAQSNRAKQLWTESLSQKNPSLLSEISSGALWKWWKLTTQNQVTDRTPPCQRWHSAYSCTTESLDQTSFELIRVWNCGTNLLPNTNPSLFWNNIYRRITWKKCLVSTVI